MIWIRPVNLKENADLETFGTMDFRKVLIMFAFFAALVAIVYGGIKMDWDMEETAAIFLGLAVVEGAIAGFGPSKISKDFLTGCKKDAGRSFYHRYGKRNFQHHEIRQYY